MLNMLLKGMIRAPFVFACLLAGIAAMLAPAPNARALDAIPLYEIIDLGQMVREVYPTAGVVSAAALNEANQAAGYLYVDSNYLPTVYTEAHGVHFLPGLPGYTSHKAVDISNRNPETGVVYIAGYSQQTSMYSDPGRAVMWIYDTVNGQVVETIDVGVLSGCVTSELADVNDQGIAIGRSVGCSTVPFTRAMVFEEATRTLDAIDLPFAPIGINNANQVAGGTYRADLVRGAGWTVGALNDLGLPAGTWGGTIYALNENGDVTGYSIRTYTDGAGRYVKAGTRYTEATRLWDILWSNSAFDYALGLNNAGDTVGTLGISSATRGALYIDALDQTYLIEDLTDPPSAAWTGYDINDNGWIAGGSVLYKHVGPMPPPSAPISLTAVPHYPTWQQPWNAITLAWENTSTRTWDYTIERRVAGTATWTVIRENWSVPSMWDTSVDLATNYEYRVRARGIAGFSEYSNIATATSPSEPVDRTAPTVSFTAPANGTKVSGTVSVSTEASDNVGVTYLSVNYSGPSGSGQICVASPGGVTSYTLSCNWNTKRLTAGIYSLTASASDAMGNGSNAGITIEVVAEQKGGGGGGGGGGKGGKGGRSFASHK